LGFGEVSSRVDPRIVVEAEIMNKEALHKFQEKMELTYKQYFQTEQFTVELAKALERALGKDRTLEIIRKWAEKSRVQLAKNQTSRKSIKNFEDFKLLFRENYGSPFWTHALTLTYPGETPKKLSCPITECLIAETYREMNATDLGYILYCHPDFATERTYHPKMRLRRTKTLMQGDSYCNRTYYWKE
jgi:hypothetical protein